LERHAGAAYQTDLPIGHCRRHVWLDLLLADVVEWLL
jgi:hypothetical protein